MLFTNMNMIIIIVTCIVSVICFYKPDLLQRLMHNPYNVAHRREYYRWITSGFVHADPMHLLFNMMSLYSIGEITEVYFENDMPGGKWLYLLLYLSAIVVSDLPSFFKNKNNVYYNSLGASGAVSAVIFSFVLFNPNAQFYGFIPSYIFAVLFLMLSHYFNQRGGGGINHSAHLFGALYGLSFTIIFNPTIVSHFIQRILS